MLCLRRSARIAPTAAAETTKPKRPAPKPLDDALGPKINYADMEFGKTYYARLPPQSTWFKSDWIFIGKFVGIYEPGSTTLKTPSSKPYAIFNAVEIMKGTGAPHTVYKVEEKRDHLLDLYLHRGYMNKKHPDRMVYLPTAKWSFYNLKPYTPAELTGLAPALSALPEGILGEIAELAPPTTFTK
jgi:hypothetical protein